MGKSSPKQPAQPDPQQTAAAQTSVNRDAALWNAALNNVNQVTPFGSLTFRQTGGGPQYNMEAYNRAMQVWNSAGGGAGSRAGGAVTADDVQRFRQATRIPSPSMQQVMQWRDSSGAAGRGAMPRLEDFKTGDLPPQYTSTIALDPAEQRMLDAQRRISESMLPQIERNLTQPVYGTTPEEVALRAEEAIMSRLNSRFANDEESLRTRLINQGIGQGSKAYDREFDALSRARLDARMQAILGGQQYGGQMLQQSLAARRAPLEELISLRSGTAPTTPQFQQSNMGGANPADLQGAIQNNYNQSLNNYNAQVASNNSMTGGLLGLAGNAAGGFLGSKAGSSWLAGLFSDIRLKENINPAGERNGLPWYEFNYKGDQQRYMGVMAQDVVRVMPEAVAERDGYLTVNYNMLGLQMEAV